MAENLFHTNEDVEFAKKKKKKFQRKMFKIIVRLLTPLEYTIQIHSPASLEAGVL